MKKSSAASRTLSWVLVILCAAPFAYVLVRGFISTDGTPTLKYYYTVFLSTVQYLQRFWKSLALGVCVMAGQTTVSVLAGFGFAKCRFPGKNAVFFLLMILMILPLQVTLVPNYLVLEEMGLLDTYFALALPAVFVPLGTFIMARSFQAVSDEVIESARLDGCGTLGIIFRVAVPMSKSGVVCVALLSFLDAWNMVEQPIAYLKDFRDYPLSVALAFAESNASAEKLVCCLLAVLPPLFLFLYFNRELVEGIAVGGEK